MALKKRAWRSEKGHGAQKKGHGAAPCYFALDIRLDLDIWTDWCRLGLQFVVYKSAEQEWSFVN